MNHITLIGRYVQKPKQLVDSTSSTYANFKVQVKSNYRNHDGEFTYDYFDVVLWKGLSKEYLTSLELNTILAIKGRLEKKDEKIIIIAENIDTYPNI